MNTEHIKEYDNEFTYMYDSFLKDWMTYSIGDVLTCTYKGETETYKMDNEEDVRRLYINKSIERYGDTGLFERFEFIVDQYIGNVFIAQDMAYLKYEEYLEYQNELLTKTK